MQNNKSKSDRQKKRKEIYREVCGAFEQKYSWLGHQAARELLLSCASWNIDKYSDPPMRFRNHVMLAWERGWLKSSILTKMATVLGEDLCSVMGKVTDAGMRGSVSSGQFTPPKPLKTPIVISTEFGQTAMEDELLNMFLSLLEEGYTNVTLNKVGQLPESQRRDIEKRYDGMISFGEENEFDLQTNFVFWGATYDPSKLQDDALRSRFNIVTPSKPLTGSVTEAIDGGSFQISNDTIRELRREIKSQEPVQTDFQPPSYLYEKYNLIPRESRDVQAYMAARNWWGLEVNPEVMEDYISYLKESRRKAMMDPEERILSMIFNNPKSYEEIERETGYEKLQIYKIIEKIGARSVPAEDGRKFAVYSGEEQNNNEDEEESSFLDGL